MLTCYKCGAETENASKSKNHVGEGFCLKCMKNLKRKIARQDKDEAMKACGLVKVRGALGGIYWE